MNGLRRRVLLRSLAGLGISATGLVLLDGCGLLPPARQPAKVPRIGFIGDSPDEPWVKSLWEGLRELGWVEGQNLTVERRDLPGTTRDERDMDAAVGELTALRVDVLVVFGSPAAIAAKRATDTIPIVFTGVADPVGVGLVASLARPGGNVTGVSVGASTQLDAKQVELIKAVLPGLQHLAVMYELAGGGVQSSLAFARVQEAAGVLGVQVQQLDTGFPVDLENAFASATSWPADAVMVRGGLVAYRARIADLAARSHLPTIYGFTEFVDAGGLMSYGKSNTSAYRHAATFVDKILRGAKPADLPVEQLTTIDFVVNLKTAQALGITFPPDVAAQVTEWIQ